MPKAELAPLAHRVVFLVLSAARSGIELYGAGDGPVRGSHATVFQSRIPEARCEADLDKRLKSTEAINGTDVKVLTADVELPVSAVLAWLGNL